MSVDLVDISIKLRHRFVAFFFTPASPTNLGICRFLAFGWVLQRYVNLDSREFRDLAEVMWQPIWVFQWLEPLGLARPGPEVLGFLDFVFKARAAAELSGVCNAGEHCRGFSVGRLPARISTEHGEDQSRDGIACNHDGCPGLVEVR